MNFWSLDLETNGREFRDPRFRILMSCIDDGRTVKVFRDPAVAARLWSKAEAPVGHNSSFFDRVALKQVTGVNVKTHDTMLMAYLLDEEAGQRGNGGLKLENLAVKYLGVEPWKDAVTWNWEDTDGWLPDDPRWATMERYCARDTQYTRRLADTLEVRLRAESLFLVYIGLLLPASRALSQLEETGVYVSQANLAAAESQFELERKTALAKLKVIGVAAGMDNFNPGSSQQVGTLLFDRMGLQPDMWTDGGKPATHELALKMIREKGKALDVVGPLLDYRGATKMLSTYIRPYTKLQKESPDGRVHPSYSLTFTVTGRTSSFSPNIQNVPRLPQIRSIVGAPPGHVLLQADLSQAELRIAAFLAREQNMLNAFRSGDDLHYLMAEHVTGKLRADITKEERTNAKISNFAFVYGAETRTFIDAAMKDYDIVFGFDEADKIRTAFFDMWPGLIPWYQSVHKELMDKEYVTSKTGRRRRFPGYKTYSTHYQTECLRAGINFGVQSLASDIALMALVLVTGKGYKTTAYIHDAVQVEVEEGKVEEAARDIKTAIEQDVPALLADRFNIHLDVPLVADISVGPDWGNLTELRLTA